MLVLLVLWAPAGAAEPPLRIAASAWVGDAPTKVAEGLGCFNRRPLPHGVASIQVDHYASGRRAFEALLTGEADFALVATTPLALHLLSTPGQVAGEEQVVIIASVALSNLSHQVIARGDQGIGQPADLAGRRVALMHDTSAHFAWSRFATYAGLTDDPPVLVDVPVEALAGALLDGAVQAVVLWEPWSTDLLAMLGSQAVSFSIRKLFSVNWLLVTRRGIAQVPGGAADYVVACYAEAINHIEVRPEQARRLHADATGRTTAELAALEDGYIWHLGLNWSVLVNVETQFEWLRSRPGFGDRSPPLPRDYLEAGPMTRVWPEGLALPDVLLQPAGRRLEPSP